MSPDDDGLGDSDVQAALAALAAAQQRAVDSGRTIVVVENGNLVRKGPNEYIVLRELPPLQVASTRIKYAEPRTALQ